MPGSDFSAQAQHRLRLALVHQVNEALYQEGQISQAVYQYVKERLNGAAPEETENEPGV